MGQIEACDCRHTALRPAIAGEKDIAMLEELGMGSSEVFYEYEWLVVGQCKSA